MLGKLFYADDMVENAKTEEKMQVDIDRVSQVYENYDQSARKSLRKYTSQHPEKLYSEPTITVNRQSLHVVAKFTYLESALR